MNRAKPSSLLARGETGQDGISNHMRNPGMTFDAFTFIEMKPEELAWHEQCYIRKFAPRFNVQHYDRAGRLPIFNEHTAKLVRSKPVPQAPWMPNVLRDDQRAESLAEIEANRKVVSLEFEGTRTPTPCGART